jgi:hypothetical protein
VHSVYTSAQALNNNGTRHVTYVILNSSTISLQDVCCCATPSALSIYLTYTHDIWRTHRTSTLIYGRSNDIVLCRRNSIAQVLISVSLVHVVLARLFSVSPPPFLHVRGMTAPTLITVIFADSSTYDHRRMIALDPVRSPHVKPSTGGLVVRWVTTGESPLLYVFGPTFLLSCPTCMLHMQNMRCS